MKCPHCLENFHDENQFSEVYLGKDEELAWAVAACVCPACKKMIVQLRSSPANKTTPDMRVYLVKPTINIVHPRGSSRTPCPKEVPAHIAEDYNEACLVLPDSAKASAALSRRCLQNLLRDAAKVQPGNLNNEIEDAIKKGLPSYLAQLLHDVRTIGNFAAHPEKDKATGEILPVEQGEAESNLDTLEGLFDFYYVQPSIAAKKRADLNSKLKAAGKQPLK